MFDNSADRARATLALLQALLVQYLRAGAEVLRSFPTDLGELQQDTKAVGESVVPMVMSLFLIHI